MTGCVNYNYKNQNIFLLYLSAIILAVSAVIFSIPAVAAAWVENNYGYSYYENYYGNGFGAYGYGANIINFSPVPEPAPLAAEETLVTNYNYNLYPFAGIGFGYYGTAVGYPFDSGNYLSNFFFYTTPPYTYEPVRGVCDSLNPRECGIPRPRVGRGR